MMTPSEIMDQLRELEQTFNADVQRLIEAIITEGNSPISCPFCGQQLDVRRCGEVGCSKPICASCLNHLRITAEDLE